MREEHLLCSPHSPSRRRNRSRRSNVVGATAATHPSSMCHSMASMYRDRASQILYLLVGIVEALMITRVVPKLLAANSGAGWRASSMECLPH